MTHTETMTMAEFISSRKITMTAERVDANPNMDSQDMDHWKVTLRRYVAYLDRGNGGRSRTLTTYFSMGYGHKGKAPTADKVLDCLASDAHGANSETFEDWCSNYGYDADSRKAEKTYKACERTRDQLRRFLDGDLDTIFYGVERL